MPNIEPPDPVTADPTDTERYMAAFLILFDKKPSWRQKEIDINADSKLPMNRWSSEFSKEVIELAESQFEPLINEVDAFVVNLRLLEKTANNVPEIAKAEETFMEEAEPPVPFKFN